MKTRKMTKSTFALTVLASSLTVAYGTARSAESDEVAEMIQPSSTVSVGVGQWDKKRPKMGGFDGMRKERSYLLLDADLQKREEASGTWLNLSITNLGTDNREIRGEYLQQGSQGVTVEYSRFRSDAPYTINTNITGIGTSRQALGANIPNTAIGSGADYQLGIVRNKGGLSFYKNLMPNLDLNFKLSSEDKKGTRLSTNGDGLFVADLINWTTRKAEATLDYTGESLQLSGGYLGSWFKNSHVLGYVAHQGSGNLMTQPLDNQAHQGFVSGSYSFTPTTKGTFKLAFTRGTQNEPLQTAGISSATYGNVPNLHGKVDTTLMQLGLTAKPLPQLSVVAGLRYQDVEDKSWQFGSVRSTSNTANITLNTSPYSYKTTSGKLEGTYTLPQGYSLTAGMDSFEQTRTVVTMIQGVAYQAYVPGRTVLEEATYRLQLRKSLSETLNGSLAYLQSNRDGSDFSLSTQVGTAVVSPVNSADRDRHKLRMLLDWSPIEKLDLQLAAEGSKDDYGSTARPQGLDKGYASLLSLDINYRLSDSWLITGWYANNTNEANYKSYGTATNDMLKQQIDTGNAIGLNLTGKITAKTKIGADLSWSNDRTAFMQTNSNGTATGAGAPEISSTAMRFKFFAEHALDKSADLRFDLIHERWRTDDWQWTYNSGLPWQYGTVSDGTTVITTPRQNATFIGARYILKFQ